MNARSNALRMAKRFIAGTSVEEVFQTVGKLRKQGFAFTLDLSPWARRLSTRREADKYQRSYLELISGLAALVQ